MVKKTAAKRRIKGGNKTTDILGPFIPQSLYELKNIDPEKHKLEKLEESYENKQRETDNKLAELKSRFKLMEDVAKQNKEAALKVDIFNLDKKDKSNKFNLELAKYGTNIVSATFTNIVMFGAYIIENIKFGFTLFGTSGQGVLVKLIVVIVLIIVIVLGVTTSIFSNPGSVIGANSISKNILNSDIGIDNYIIPHNSFSFLKTMSNGFNNLLPDNVKYKFASFTNSINYIATGKNQYDDLLIDRETITDGRSDNIFHMNIRTNDKYDKNKTYCAIEPKQIVFNYNSNLYASSDYNKIDETLRTDINYPSQYIIPITADNNGKYILNVASSSYNIDPNNNVKLPKLFKKSGSNDIVFNTVPVYKSSSLNMFGILGLYGTRLLNTNYKGPILKITSINYSQLGLDENANKDEFLLYYENKAYYYYDKFKNTIIFTELSFTKAFYVNILYDQSGNNRDFVYKKSDNKYQPEFKISNNIGYLYFPTKNILYLDKSITNVKIRVQSKIQVIKLSEDGTSVIPNYNKIGGYMNLLSSYTAPILKLEITKTTTNNQDNYIIDTQPENNPNDNNIEFKSVKYTTGTIEEIKADIDIKERGIETLGTVHDDRTSDYEKQNDKGGAILTSNIEAHNFIGNLYELYIYDRSKL